MELKLSNQLCFPLYAASKEVVKKYTPLLSPFGLTYTQYITMLALWEVKSAGVKALGEMLFLDSGTLTPVLKKLEADGCVLRKRDENDERNVIISLTQKGEELKESVKDVPLKLAQCIDLSEDEAKELYRLLYKVLGK